MAVKKTTKKNDELSFEDSMARLGQIVTELEAGKLSLEESLERFEEGVKLARVSQARLDRAEAQVEELLDVTTDGIPVAQEIEIL